MKLKALLLGSAAAMMTVSGAIAADAVVAEPEPVDYVKVCDMYGAGFYYIPGTERCLKISGEMRVQYEYTETEGQTTSAGSTGSAYWHGRVNFDAREETDYGTLRTFLRLEGDGNNGNSLAPADFYDAYIELGGWSTGYRTTRFELAGLPGLMYDGRYGGGGRTMYMDYTYAANGLSLTGGISLDNETLAAASGGAADDESVDAYIRMDYAGSMYNIAASYAHDNSADEGAFFIWGNITPMDGFVIQGYYTSQDNHTQFGGGAIGDAQRWGIGASYQITDAVKIAGGYYEQDATGATNDVEGWSLGLDWKVVDNLVVRLGYNNEDQNGTDVDDYRIRIQSNF